MRIEGIGLYWNDQEAGLRYRTLARTITETDVVLFVGVTGMTEVLFTDTTFSIAGHPKPAGRIVPSALCYTLMEGLICQGPIQGTGLALLEVSQTILAPTFVGETLHCEIEVLSVRPTSKGGRGIVETMNHIVNATGEIKMTYRAVRMQAGRPAA
jgi:acyl dehydratase